MVHYNQVIYTVGEPGIQHQCSLKNNSFNETQQKISNLELQV